MNLENVHQWSLANKLIKLNKDKTEYMIIGSRQRISNLVTDPKIELGESVIKRVHKSKTLGVIIDEHLLWNHQIQTTVTKASKGIGMMRRIKQFVHKSTFLKINLLKNILEVTIARKVLPHPQGIKGKGAYAIC